MIDILMRVNNPPADRRGFSIICFYYSTFTSASLTSSIRSSLRPKSIWR